MLYLLVTTDGIWLDSLLVKDLKGGRGLSTLLTINNSLISLCVFSSHFFPPFLFTCRTQLEAQDACPAGECRRSGWSRNRWWRSLPRILVRAAESRLWPEPRVLQVHSWPTAVPQPSSQHPGSQLQRAFFLPGAHAGQGGADLWRWKAAT